MRIMVYISIIVLAGFFGRDIKAQGTINFQNLNFENGTFIPIPGDPYNQVQFSAALPGWTGYVGTNQVDRLQHNDLFLSLAGISIRGPDYPSPGLFHGQYYVVLEGGLDPSNIQNTVGAAISQTGTIPSTALSIRFLTENPFAIQMNVSFSGIMIPMVNLGVDVSGRPIWGGDVSTFAGQTGELRFQGSSYLDYIQFSNQQIPEPSSLGLFSLGALLLSFRSRLARRV